MAGDVHWFSIYEPGDGDGDGVDSGVGDIMLIITNLPILGPMKQQPMREQPPASKWTTPGLDFFIGILSRFQMRKENSLFRFCHFIKISNEMAEQT